MSETELLNRIKADPSAFSELFNLYYKPIFGYIFRRTGDFDYTADIAADSFLKAFIYIRHFKYRGISVKVWLYRIATNEVNLYFRNKQKHISLFKRHELGDIEKFGQYFQDDKATMEREFIQHNQFQSILKYLKELPVKYQEVIALRYFEGKGNKEICQILDVNEGTVKSLLSRGLEKLRVKCNQI
ncbi:RNA polymerase sigma factor [Flavitalea flava]